MRASSFALFAASIACGPPPAPPAAVESAPPPPAVASAAAPTPPRAPELVEVTMIDTACVVEADAPGGEAFVGVQHVYVGGKSVASVNSLGKTRRVHLGLAEGTPANASVLVDGTIAAVRGSAPLQSGTTDDITIYPRSHVVRAGWLTYKELRVVSVHDTSLEPKTTLPAWIVPNAEFAAKPFLVTCTELTPWVAKGGLTTLVNDGALEGKHIALEDDAGHELATFDPPAPVPVVIGRSVKGRTKITFDVDPQMVVEGWVASRYAKPSIWGGYGYGDGHGTGRSPAQITCDTDVPLHVHVGETTYAFGTLHAKQSVDGELTDSGDFEVVLGGAVSPFVPRVAARRCTIEAFRPPSHQPPRR